MVDNGQWIVGSCLEFIIVHSSFIINSPSDLTRVILPPTYHQPTTILPPSYHFNISEARLGAVFSGQCSVVSGSAGVTPAWWAAGCGSAGVTPAWWAAGCGSAGIPPAWWAAGCGSAGVTPAWWAMGCGSAGVTPAWWAVGSTRKWESTLRSHSAGGPPAYQDCPLSVLIPQAGRLRTKTARFPFSSRRRAACVPRLPTLRSHPAGGPPAYQGCPFSAFIPQASRLRTKAARSPLSFRRRAACVPRLPVLRSHSAGRPPAYQDCPFSVLIPQAGRLRTRERQPVLHSPLSTLHSPLSALRSPLSTLHSPLSTLRSPFSTLHSPLSRRRQRGYHGLPYRMQATIIQPLTHDKKRPSEWPSHPCFSTMQEIFFCQFRFYL